MIAEKLPSVAHIIANRRRYNDTLYTQLPDAYRELERRQADPLLEQRVSAFLGGDVLEPLRERPRAVLARSVMSPNYEVRLFSELTSKQRELEPLYLEYRDDKFASNNELKRMLGRLYFYNGRGRHEGTRIDSYNVIDFNASDGKKISSMKTRWGQNFVEFHHELFDTNHKKLSHTFHDTSRWLEAHGGRAGSYYRAFLTLFIRHGILFENVMLDAHELPFTTGVFLPAFLSVFRHFGLKPLIVPIEPIETEESRIWLCYPGRDKLAFIDRLRPHEDSSAPLAL